MFHSGLESLVGRILISNSVMRRRVMEASGMLWENSKWRETLTARLTIMLRISSYGLLKRREQVLEGKKGFKQHLWDMSYYTIIKSTSANQLYFIICGLS